MSSIDAFSCCTNVHDVFLQLFLSDVDQLVQGLFLVYAQVQYLVLIQYHRMCFLCAEVEVILLLINPSDIPSSSCLIIISV